MEEIVDLLGITERIQRNRLLSIQESLIAKFTTRKPIESGKCANGGDYREWSSLHHSEGKNYSLYHNGTSSTFDRCACGSYGCACNRPTSIIADSDYEACEKAKSILFKQ